eukprot:TRINITY_DN9551_c0_g1_i4.p1 TRINITY_DN9551_c0_g1~~TRINITY_DN9551_c0_g1_i4.p1  ORF type:complete len:420 (-),score=95.17 TRINITY_DN9551_c0_g1_i4:251-1510(-)
MYQRRIRTFDRSWKHGRISPCVDIFCIIALAVKVSVLPLKLIIGSSSLAANDLEPQNCWMSSPYGFGFQPKALSGRHLRMSSLSAQGTSGPDGVPGRLDPGELLAMLQRPGAIEDVQEIMQKLMKDKQKRTSMNSTIQQLGSAFEDNEAESFDPFAKLLSNPQALIAALQNPERSQELREAVEGSSIFEDMRDLGRTVIEQMQIARLKAGAKIEIHGLKAASELNGLVGVLCDPTPEEAEANPERRVVELEDGVGRISVQPENLIFPRHLPGDAVLLAAEFEPGSEHEGLEGRAAVVSLLTEEELALGFGSSAEAGRAVVDVLSLLPGGPITQRLLMWPEHLKPRRYQPGDGVVLAALESDASLNGAAATVVEASQEEASTLEPSAVVIALDSDGRRLQVRRRNLRLSSVALPGWTGIG